MTTFSQLVDSIIRETNRPDLLEQISTYLNQTIREIHFQPTGQSSGGVIFYSENLKEIQVTANSDALIWAIPDPTNFQTLASVRYDSVVRDGKYIFPQPMTPGPRMQPDGYYYYRAAGGFAFNGFGGNGALVSLAWFEYPSRLKYYAVANRPAEYDSVDGWSYLNPAGDHAVAEGLVTNWLLMRWQTVIEEGLRAKVYKRLSDDSRSKTCYSMYTQLRQGLHTSEVSSFGIY